MLPPVHSSCYRGWPFADDKGWEGRIPIVLIGVPPVDDLCHFQNGSDFGGEDLSQIMEKTRTDYLMDIYFREFILYEEGHHPQAPVVFGNVFMTAARGISVAGCLFQFFRSVKEFKICNRF